MHKTVRKKNTGATRFLLEHGASIEVKDVQGKLPVDYALDENLKKLMLPD